MTGQGLPSWCINYDNLVLNKADNFGVYIHVYILYCAAQISIKYLHTHHISYVLYTCSTYSICYCTNKCSDEQSFAHSGIAVGNDRLLLTASKSFGNA